MVFIPSLHVISHNSPSIKMAKMPKDAEREKTEKIMELLTCSIKMANNEIRKSCL